MVVLLVRLNVGGLLSATVSGTCADFVSMTHLTGLPASVMRSGQVSICGTNWLVQLRQPQSICVLLLHQGIVLLALCLYSDLFIVD